MVNLNRERCTGALVEIAPAAMPAPSPTAGRRKPAATVAIWARLLHRWCGLALGAFIVLAGLTGSLLVFQPEIEDSLNADLHRAAQAAPPLPLSALQRAVVQRYPQARIARMQLDAGPGRAMLVDLAPRTITAPLAFDQLWLDPATGETLATRRWGAVRFDRRHVMSLVYRLHRTLLLDGPGKIVTGSVALAWLLGTLIGCWLAWPRHGKWRQALTVKRGAGPFRLLYDLHRAAGLLTAPVFVLITVSALYFNLDGLVKPAINAFSPLSPAPAGRVAPIAAQQIAVAPETAVALALQRYPDGQPWRLAVEPGQGRYRVDLHRPGDLGRVGNTRVFVDMGAPRLLGVLAPGTRSAGDAYAAWQFPLHTGQFLGRYGQALWLLLGLVPLVLAASGMAMWLKKRGMPARAKAAQGPPQRL